MPVLKRPDLPGFGNQEGLIRSRFALSLRQSFAEAFFGAGAQPFNVWTMNEDDDDSDDQIEQEITPRRVAVEHEE